MCTPSVCTDAPPHQSESAPPHVADGRMSALDSWEKHCPPSNLNLHDMIASKHANISGSTKNHHAKYMHHSCQYTCINEGKPIPSQHSWDINHETSNHFYLLWIQHEYLFLLSPYTHHSLSRANTGHRVPSFTMQRGERRWHVIKLNLTPWSAKSRIRPWNIKSKAPASSKFFATVLYSYSHFTFKFHMLFMPLQ